MSAHTDRIAFAKANKACFACASYCGQFSLLSSICLAGGLDPEWTNAATDDATRRIRAGVRWANGCPRFVAAMPMRVAA